VPLADGHEADLSWADLSEADLRGVNLDGATLYGASLGRADLRETSLDRVDLRGADLSWASFGGASAYEHARKQLRRRGAVFSGTTKVIVAKRFSDEAGRYALGFSLGFLFMSAVGFLCSLGMKAIFTYLRLKRHLRDGAPCQIGSSPGCRQ